MSDDTGVANYHEKKSTHVCSFRRTTFCQGYGSNELLAGCRRLRRWANEVIREIEDVGPFSRLWEARVKLGSREFD